MEIINSSKPTIMRKRGAPQQTSLHHSYEPLKLERVYGSGSCAAPAIACPHPVIPGLLAYSCGAIVVLYDGQHKQQTAFYSPKPRRNHAVGKPYACLAFSRDGAYLAAGERSPQSPEILIWEVSSSRCLQTLKGHKHGTGSIAFSQDGRLLVSTGESYDGQLCVWDWQAGMLLARQHTQAEVQRACFAEELAAGVTGLTITTVGKAGHFKVWSLSLPSGRGRDGQLTGSQASLTPRPASLKEYRSCHFVGVAATPVDGAHPGLLYALTQNGILLTLRPATRTIDKSLSLQVPAAFALAVSPSLIACACAAGVVRLFATRTLAFKGNLPRPTASNSTGRSTGGGGPLDGASGGGARSSGGGVVSGPGGPGPDPMTSAGALFPDAVGCAFDSGGDRLTVVYADRSLMVWDVRNPARVTRMRSVLSHAGVVWSAALIPAWQAALLGGPSGSAAATPTATSNGGGEGGRGAQGSELVAPSSSSVLCTCGADGTVRLWNVCLNNSTSTAGPFGVPTDMAAAAKVTRTLRAIIQAMPPPVNEAGSGAAAIGGTAGVGAAGNRRYAPDAPLPVPGVNGLGAAAAGGNGGGAAAKPVVLRCLRISPCGRHLATGDARGNLRVFSLGTLQLLMLKEAHDAEILSLDYSQPSLDGACYLASSSRDTLVHVYEMSRGYELVGTCDAHSGAVTAVRFSAYGGRLALLSCSADKSVVFRLVQLGPCGLSFEVYHTERMPRGVLYDMAVDPAGGRAVAVAQDNQLRLFDVATGRNLRTFSGDPSCGEAVAVTMDASGHLAICSCADGSVAVYDVDAGNLLARGSGHSDVCTGAVLLEDHRGLVTVGGDGCALLWRLSPRLAQRMQEAGEEARRQLEEQAALQVEMLLQQQQQQPRQQQQQEMGRVQGQVQADITPAVRRRKAWDLGGAVDGRAAVAGEVGCYGGGEEAHEEEPQQVHVDMSATVLRIREGKPLLSLEKLPRWAQRTPTPEAEAQGAVVSAGCTTTATGADSSIGGDSAAAAATARKLAGVWAQRAALQPRDPSAPEAAVESADAAAAEPLVVAVTAVAAAAAANDAETASDLPVPFAYATAAAAARAGALAGQPRTWAEVVEEDDEIVFCDSLEDTEGPLMLVGDAQDTSAESELDPPAAAAAGAMAEAAVAAAAADGTPAEANPDPGSGGSQGAACPGSAGQGAKSQGEGPQEAATPRAPPPAQADGEVDDPASGCASNCPGQSTRQEAEEDAVATGNGDAVKPRDLFREHFDSLGLDQASATKAPPPDPRRVSFTLIYRQVRASSGAGGHPDGVGPPEVGVAAAEPPTTPHLSKLPLAPAANTVRGAGGLASILQQVDASGAMTSVPWTPERAMLPLMSPALAKTDKQLQELERIRLRLLSTLRKRQSNEETALGPSRSGVPLAASPLRAPELTAVQAEAAAAAGSPAAAPEDRAVLSTVGALDGAAAPPGQEPPRPPPAAAGADAAAHPQAVVGAGAGARSDSVDKQQQPPREKVQSTAGFLLPPPPAYTPAGTPAAIASEHLPIDTPVAQNSPGFSSLSTGTPMLGQGCGGADALSPVASDGHIGDGGTASAAARAENDGNRLFVFNPIYGASPSTPIMGGGAMSPVAAVMGMHRGAFPGLSPRSGGAGGDAGRACSPVGSDAAGPTMDDVIRAVLESEGGGAADGDAAAVAGGGVCVVTKEGSGGTSCGTGKEQRWQASAPEALCDVESSPGKGLQMLRPRLALPPMKPSPAKSRGSPATSITEVATSPQELTAGAVATEAAQMEVRLADTDAAAPFHVGLRNNFPPCSPSTTNPDEPLARMQLALRDFAVAYRRMIAVGTAPGPASPMARGAASRYQAAARSAMTELGALLSAQQDAVLARPQEAAGSPGRHQRLEASEVPPAVVCHSPQVSQDMSGIRRAQHGLSRIGRGFRSGLEAAASAVTASVSGSMTAARAGSGGCPAVSSSQVVVEMGLVESMVEEKLEQRMQEEMRRVEEAVMQRIMETMMQKQQQQR